MRKSALIASAASVATLVVIAASGASVQAQTESPKQTSTNQNQPGAAVSTAAQPAPVDKQVTVAAGDSLDSIAQANQSTWVRLFDANLEINDPNLIYPGQNLKIPADSEQLQSRALPADAPVTTPVVSAPERSNYQAVPSSAPAVAGGSVWDRLAACESGGNWSINTGNGFYGGLQFTQGSWNAVGGSGSPANASRDEQIMRAQMLQARQGWGAWPACSAKLGL